jgi:asparagine synthase (glutamine-hydrolysing)
MCGVAGAFRPGGEVTTRTVELMLDRIHHRGPDGRGVVSAGPCALGHVRLAILDLSDRAAQPMRSRCGRFLLSYNGEVYNFAELRSRLERAGVEFVSTGDTEVLLEHLAMFGLDDTLPRIEGFFAFALWDVRRGELALARDRWGKKPLYWQIRSGELRFASEVKALATSDVRPDLTTLEAMLLGFSGTWGRHTSVEGIESVEPGAVVHFAGDTTPRRRAWFRIAELVDPDLYREMHLASVPDVVDRVNEALAASLEHRMVSDVPVASLVSGGVDSSLVTALACAGDREVALYHADVVADTERPAAEELVHWLGRQLRVAQVTDDVFLEQVCRATWFNDGPLTYHVNAVPFLSVCELAGSDGVKVLLSGEGSDEFFLGYPTNGLAPYLDAADAAKAHVRGLVRRAGPRVVDRLWPSARDSYNTMLRELVARAEGEPTDILASTAHVRGRAERRALAANITLGRAHLTSLLHRNDRLGMAAGLESRFPFLGRDLTRLAINLPARYKLRWAPRTHDRRHPFLVDKWVVREIAQRYLPRSLAVRQKQGFPARVHARLVVDAAHFDDGFVRNAWGLDGALVSPGPPSMVSTWQLRLALVEVWGRLTVLGEPLDSVAEHLRRHVRQVS